MLLCSFAGLHLLFCWFQDLSHRLIVGMTEEGTAIDAEGATGSNIGNPQLEDKSAICDTAREEQMDVDEKKEAKEMDIDGQEKSKGKKDVNKDDHVLEEGGEEKKEGEAEEDGEEKKEGEIEEDGKEEEEGETKEEGEEEKEGEIEEDGAEKKGGEIEDDGDKKTEGKVDGDEKREGGDWEKEVDVKDGDKMKKGEVKENGDKKNEGKEVIDALENEDGQQTDITNLENVGSEKEYTENVNTVEPEDVKMVDAEHVKADAVDVKMVDAEDVKDEEKGGETVERGVQDATENDVNLEEDVGITAEKVNEDKGGDRSKKKRSGPKKSGQKGEGKDKDGETKAMKLLASPGSSIERPVRERKTVERLVEVIEKEPNKEFQVEKGRGTPLKDIPNVAHKLARKRPADIKLIHQTLFGRKGKAVNFKSHILQFSGFVWHESDEKQRAKMKEKLDKYVKDTLLDLCDLFDLSVSRANSRKEDLVTKLLDFLVAPHSTTDSVHAEDQKSRKRKRMDRGSASKRRGVLTKHPEKWIKSEETAATKESSAQETEDEEEDEKVVDVHSEEKVRKHSESEAKETESGEDEDEDDDDVDEYDEKKLGKGKPDKRKVGRRQGSVAKEKLKVGTSPKKSSLPMTTNSPAKRSFSKRSKAEEDNDASMKVFVSKKRNLGSPKKKSTPKSNTKEKTTDKKTARGKPRRLEVEQPTKEELRNKICEILKEVDFNTATFTDILKQLAAYYKMDLTPRKASLKLMIQEELTKLAEEDEEDEDEDDDDAEKEGKPESKGKAVEA
ncbi:DEK domain-containing chromatin-associated protein 1-like isoform X2 [Musa acuminata AAA Group]|uniref:DEK domain-containing chromatin-associated protein 1-like isoform X2 n=1 Tax=Musa acuminata AAA Group TaxID=214697 RepID=UPI0031DB8B49